MSKTKQEKIKKVSGWFASIEGKRQTETALQRARSREETFRRESQVDIKKLHEPFTI